MYNCNLLYAILKYYYFNKTENEAFYSAKILFIIHNTVVI